MSCNPSHLCWIEIRYQVSLKLTFCRLFNFIVGLIVPPMLESIGWGTFIFFAAFATLAGIWTFFFVPETKDKTLEQLDRLFNDATGQKDEERRQRILGGLAVEIYGPGGQKLTGDSSSDTSSDKIRVERHEEV